MEQRTAGYTRNLYESQSKRNTLRYANGVACMFLGFALGDAFALLPERSNADIQEIIAGLDRLVGLMTKDIVELPHTQSHPISYIIEIIGILIGVGIIKNAKEDDKDFREAFPHLDYFYSQEQRKHARITWIACFVGAIALIAATAAILVCCTQISHYLAGAILLFACAIGMWIMVYGYYTGIRTNIFMYNFRSLQYVNIYELHKGEQYDDVQEKLAQKLLADISICASQTAIALGIIAALCLHFLPTLKTTLFWVPLVIMVAIAMIVKWCIFAKAQRLYDHSLQ